MIVPEPFSSNHDSYLSNYNNHGVTHVLNRHSQLFAVHRNGFIVPADMFVREVSSCSVKPLSDFFGEETAGSGGGIVGGETISSHSSYALLFLAILL